MLYLLTGQPGSGKTNYMVSQLAKSPDLKDRVVYVDGIPELDRDKIPYLDIPEGHSPEDWPEWLPDGAVLVVDECQRYFRPRPSRQMPPASITELETHRHRGVDFFFITQHTRLIDVNVKSFVENHKHFGKTQLGTRRIFEWQRTGNTDSRADTNAALVHPHKFDKSVYDLYKSAEIHTKIKTGRSKWVYAMPVILLLFIVLAWFSYGFIKNMTNSAANTQTTTEQSTQSVLPSEPSGSIPAQQSANINTPLSLDDYKPAIDGQPWTAPIYNGLNRQIKAMPYPVGCVATSNTCTCYTAQSTPVSVTEVFCRHHIEKGVFNPYYASGDSHAT